FRRVLFRSGQANDDLPPVFIDRAPGAEGAVGLVTGIFKLLFQGVAVHAASIAEGAAGGPVRCAAGWLKAARQPAAQVAADSGARAGEGGGQAIDAVGVVLAAVGVEAAIALALGPGGELLALALVRVQRDAVAAGGRHAVDVGKDD